MSSKQRKNTVKLPQTALAFYIKLYCDRKSCTKSKYQNNLIEATKSFLSLTESEKQKVLKKFEECQAKHKARILYQLKSAKPYLKIKESSSKITNSIINDLEHNESHEEVPDCSPVRTQGLSPPLELTNSENNFCIESTNLESHTVNEFEENLNILEADQENDEPQPQTFFIEPIPPTIKTGQELFYLLNSTDDNGNITWKSMPQFEKNRYSRAVSLLKKDYISKYKEYLERLSSKELFDHYYKSIVQYVLIFILSPFANKNYFDLLS